MLDLCRLIWRMFTDLFRSRATLEAEILVLQRQINVLRRGALRKLAFNLIDRLIFIGLYRLFPQTCRALAIVKPDPFIRWHRAGFRSYWRWQSRRRWGRHNGVVRNSPADPRDERRQPVVGSAENPWRVAQAWHRDRPDQRRQVYGAEEGPPSQDWKTFLRNHADGIAAMDLSWFRQ